MVAGSLIYRGVYEFIVLVVPMGCLRNEGLEVLKRSLARSGSESPTLEWVQLDQRVSEVLNVCTVSAQELVYFCFTVVVEDIGILCYCHVNHGCER